MSVSNSSQQPLEEVVADLVKRAESRYFGKYRGLVVDTKDPESLGRLKLRVPGIFGEKVVTGWAMPCTPYGGESDEGLFFLPGEGAGVWVEFEEGDLEFPIWTGTYWTKPKGKSELPRPNEIKSGETSDTLAEKPQSPVTRKIIKTHAGHTLQFEDKAGAELIFIKEAANSHTITLNKDGVAVRAAEKPKSKKFREVVLTPKFIAIKDGVHEHEVRLDEKGIVLTDKAGHTIQTTETKVTIKHKSGSTIEFGEDGIKLTAKGKLAISADGAITIAGKTIDLNKS